jgi:hypothetical protein
VPTWPATLPSKLPKRLRENAVDGRESFQPDAGPPIAVRRFTATPRVIEFELVLTTTQKDTLETFYKTTLKEGVLEFDWTNPATSTGFAGLHYFTFVDRPTYDWIGAKRVVTIRLRTRPGL